MNQMTKFDLSARQITLVQQTVAKDCNTDEFNLFMEAARSYGLDPFRKQIMPLVFGKNADEASKRRMSIVVSRDGLRVIAQRCKNYRPASEPAEIEFDEALKSPTNPKGIVLARVYLWQQDSRGVWFKVVGEAYWDEFAPIKHEAEGGYDWEDTGEKWPDSGKPKKRKVPRGEVRDVLDTSGQWGKMPVVMITKCAEAQALRAGWPEQFGGVYAEEEMDRARVLDLTAAEIVEQEREDHRMKAIGGNNAITVFWGENYALENVPVGQFFDRAAEFVDQEQPATVRKWQDANRDPLKLFWARHPGDALELKKLIEAKLATPVHRPVDDAFRNYALNAG